MPWSPFDHMRGKYAKRALSWVHFYEYLTVLISRIDLSGFPENILPTDTLKYLAMNGTVGCAKFKGGDYWTFPGSYCGEFYGPTVPKDYMGTLAGLGEVRGEAGKDIAVGWNNSTHSPDFILMQTSDILADIDLSEHINVLFARDMRIPKARDQKEKTAIESAIKAIREGRVDAIVDSNVHADEVINGIKTDPFLDLTEVDKIDKLQYLDQYRKAVLRRFYEYAGQKMPVGPKMAQMSVKEAGANDSISLVLLLDHFEHVKKFCDECNRLFGWNTSAKLTKCFEDEVEEMDLEKLSAAGTVETSTEGGVQDGNSEVQSTGN